jgi:hypothetical protein
VDARPIREVVRAAGAMVPEGALELELNTLFPDPGHEAPVARVVLEVGGRVLILRTSLPRGFSHIDPTRLVPVPPFVFNEGRRLIRAAFEVADRPCLLLDEEGLAGQARMACT